jgi:hypothetical protein
MRTQMDSIYGPCMQPNTSTASKQSRQNRRCSPFEGPRPTLLVASPRVGPRNPRCTYRRLTRAGSTQTASSPRRRLLVLASAAADYDAASLPTRWYVRASSSSPSGFLASFPLIFRICSVVGITWIGSFVGRFVIVCSIILRVSGYGC